MLPPCVTSKYKCKPGLRWLLLTFVHPQQTCHLLPLPPCGLSAAPQTSPDSALHSVERSELPKPAVWLHYSPRNWSGSIQHSIWQTAKAEDIVVKIKPEEGCMS